jgi:hypothetical protein
MVPAWRAIRRSRIFACMARREYRRLSKADIQGQQNPNIKISLCARGLIITKRGTRM